MAEEMKKVKFHDDDHCWIDGKQYISLYRFSDLRADQSKEMSLLNEEVKRLTEENNAFRVLLKDMLNKDGSTN